ncbi:hypothetical protein [Nocardioides sp.]|nr:hypothetical protein [Nocardioides sp.]
MGTIASIVVGGAVAAVTVVGLVNHTVDSKPGPGQAGSVAGSTSIAYGTR